jgi:hypothetical protein
MGLLYPFQPIFDDDVGTTLKYGAHSLLVRSVSKFLNQQSFSDEFCELPDFDGFHDGLTSDTEDEIIIFVERTAFLQTRCSSRLLAHLFVVH